MDRPLAKVPLAFLAHQFLGAWGPMLAAPWLMLLFSEFVLNLGWRFGFYQSQWVLYGTPFYPAHIALGLFVGWILGGTLGHREMRWVWIIPFLSLLSVLVGFPLGFGAPIEFAVYPPIQHLTIAQHAHLPLSSKVEYLFGWGSGIQPFIQVAVTLPFYSAIAYSAGAFLARSMNRAHGLFETVRQLRVARLILIVGIPWSCLKLAFKWHQIEVPYRETWQGLFYTLEGLMVMGVIVTFLFAIAVALLGPRFGATRFFLHNTTQSEDTAAGNHRQGNF